MLIFSNELPLLVPEVAVLIVHLDPQHDLSQPCNLEIWISLEKFAYEVMNILIPLTV